MSTDNLDLRPLTNEDFPMIAGRIIWAAPRCISSLNGWTVDNTWPMWIYIDHPCLDGNIWVGYTNYWLAYAQTERARKAARECGKVK